MVVALWRSVVAHYVDNHWYNLAIYRLVGGWRK